MIIPLVDPTKIKVPSDDGGFTPWGVVGLLLVILIFYAFDFYYEKIKKR